MSVGAFGFRDEAGAEPGNLILCSGKPLVDGAFGVGHGDGRVGELLPDVSQGLQPSRAST